MSVTVTDANDHTPTFDAFPFRINVTSGGADTTVPLLRLSATDNDQPGSPNSKLTYSLVDAGSKYQLSPDQGILTASPGATWTAGTVEYVTVTVSDAGVPARTSTGLIEVSTVDQQYHKISVTQTFDMKM